MSAKASGILLKSFVDVASPIQIFYWLAPWLQWHEWLGFLKEYMPELLRHPTYLVAAPNGLVGRQLTPFWSALLTRHWTTCIATNSLPVLIRTQRWSPKVVELVYGELYRHFAFLNPNGPGLSAIQDLKESRVDIVPSLYVPTPCATILLHTELLFVYRCIAHYLNKYSGTDIQMAGVMVPPNAQNIQSWSTWWEPFGTGFQKFQILLPNPHSNGFVVENQAYVKRTFPSDTAYDRFRLAQFIMNYLVLAEFCDQPWHIRLDGRDQKGLRRSLVDFVESDLSIGMTNKIAIWMNASIGGAWTINIRRIK